MNINFFQFYWAIQKKMIPGLKYSQEVYEDILNMFVCEGKKWLDLGCGHQILPHWRQTQESLLLKKCRFVVGLDYDDLSLRKHKNIKLKVRGDITKLPFTDNSFDLVTANMAVEHLALPENQFREVRRVLRDGGLFIFHTPNILGYTTVLSGMLPKKLKSILINFFQGRDESDIFDTYFRANSKKKICAIAQTIDFEVIEIKMITSSAQFVMIPPLMIFELIWIKILMLNLFSPLRPNIIAIFKKMN